MYIDQISVFLENETNAVAEVTGILKNADVNIRALSLAGTGRYGVLHMILDEPEKGRAALKAAGMTVAVINVIAVKMGDAPGSLHEIFEAVGSAGLSVEYAYAYVSQQVGAAIVIMRIEETAALSGALEALQKAGLSLLSPQEAHG